MLLMENVIAKLGNIQIFKLQNNEIKCKWEIELI